MKAWFTPSRLPFAHPIRAVDAETRLTPRPRGRHLLDMTQSAERPYRDRALELYRRHDRNGQGTDIASENLIEELRIHQIELELQNEDLMRARNDAEQAREAAETERDRYFGLFHWSPIAYLLVERSGRITQANEQAATLLGVEHDRWSSRSINSFLDSDDAARATRAIEQTRTAGAAGPLTVSMRGSSTGPTFIELHMKPSDGRTETEDATVLVAMSDVTDRKLREEEQDRSLRYYRRLLQEMSHRVKNNLQVLASIIELERRGHENDPVLKRMAARVRNVARVHTALHEAATDVEHVDLVAALQNFIDQFSSSLAPHLDITFEPTPRRIVTVEAHKAAQLNLVVNELLTNAAQHAFPDNGSGMIRVSLTASERSLQLTVADNGAGMARAEPRSDTVAGQSVGSLLVEQFVDELGGEWRTESSDGVRHDITVPLQ